MASSKSLISNRQETGGVAAVMDAVLESGAHRGVKYLDPKLVIRVTRRLSRGKVPKRGAFEFNVSLCRPNYSERKFVALCKKAGENFPIKKIQLQFPPKPRQKKARKKRK